MRAAAQLAHLLAEAAVEEELGMAGVLTHKGASPGKAFHQVFVHQAGDGLPHRLAPDIVGLANVHLWRQDAPGQDQPALDHLA